MVRRTCRWTDSAAGSRRATILAAVIGTCSASEPALAEQLIERLGPGMLLLADRGCTSFALWRKAIATDRS